MPTPEHLSQWARAGAAMVPGCGRMCGDYAFRTGTIPNTDPGTAQDIEHCFYTDQDFHCAHTGAAPGEEPVCSGFSYAKKFIGSSQFIKSLKNINAK